MNICPEKFIEVLEGLAKLCVPDIKLYTRANGVYEPAWAPVFYNPNMIENRDIAVAVVNYFIKTTKARDFVVIDPLAATGVRGIRIALEVSNTEKLKVFMGDISEESAKLMNINVRLNNVEDIVSIERIDANELMYKLRRMGVKPAYIDVDPFGSPVPFTFPAVSTIKKGGIVAFTATDLAVLEGKYKDKMLRRYGVSGAITSISKDIAIRVLLSYIARLAFSLDKYIIPILSYVYKHYVRVYVHIYEGASKAINQMKKCLKMLRVCTNCSYSYVEEENRQISICPLCRSTTIGIVPIWVCRTMDKDVVNSIVEDVEAKPWIQKSSKTFLTLLSSYADVDVITIRLTPLAKLFHINTPSRSKVIQCLNEMGYKTVKSYTYTDGIATTATAQDIVRCFTSDLSRQGISI